MPVVTSSILLDVPVSTVFDLSNRIDQWPVMVPEYLKAEVLGTEGRKIWFRLTNSDGASWVSWRMLYPPYVAYAERYEPVAPFKFNHLTWAYQPLPGNRTLMVWDMYFELLDEKKAEEEQWRAVLQEHTEANQKSMRSYIEAAAANSG